MRIESYFEHSPATVEGTAVKLLKAFEHKLAIFDFLLAIVETLTATIKRPLVFA